MSLSPGWSTYSHYPSKLSPAAGLQVIFPCFFGSSLGPPPPCRSCLARLRRYSICPLDQRIWACSLPRPRGNHGVLLQWQVTDKTIICVIGYRHCSLAVMFHSYTNTENLEKDKLGSHLQSWWLMRGLLRYFPFSLVVVAEARKATDGTLLVPRCAALHRFQNPNPQVR